MPTAATITVPYTLLLLDGQFRNFADGVARDYYALWLGSGISRGRVDGLDKLVPRVIEHLRSRINPSNPTCRFRTALERVLGLASVTTEETSRIDFGKPFSLWLDSAAITARLINQYARLLQVSVANEPEDYLQWEAVNIVHTYANPATLPDVEHYCIAILILEGVATEIASANWDGLIEKATNLLADNSTSLIVYVRPEDLQQLPGKAHLYKFHGCAVKASTSEAQYRSYLIARLSQINRWPQDYPAMADRLVTLIASKPTLMIGLSAQDSNIQGIFARAQASIQWQWPGERPSLVFSASELGIDQSGLLENVYRDSYTMANREKIDESATFPAYAKPLLLSLILYVLSSKLKALIDGAKLAAFTSADKLHLQEGVTALRDLVANAVRSDPLGFIKLLIEHSGRLLSLFSTGQTPTLPTRYLPLTPAGVQYIAHDGTLQTSGLPELAIAMGVIGLLVGEGKIKVKATDPATFGSGALLIESSVGSAKVFFAANSNMALRLQVNGHVTDSNDTIVIHSLEIIPTLPRFPKGVVGRTGRSGRREVSISTLVAQTTGAAALVQRFREEAGT